MILLKYHFQPFHQQRSVHTLEGHPLDSLELRGSHSAALRCQRALWTDLCIEGYFRWGHLFEECTRLGRLYSNMQVLFKWVLGFGGLLRDPKKCFNKDECIYVHQYELIFFIYGNGTMFRQFFAHFCVKDYQWFSSQCSEAKYVRKVNHQLPLHLNFFFISKCLLPHSFCLSRFFVLDFSYNTPNLNSALRHVSTAN